MESALVTKLHVSANLGILLTIHLMIVASVIMDIIRIVVQVYAKNVATVTSKVLRPVMQTHAIVRLTIMAQVVVLVH